MSRSRRFVISVVCAFLIVGSGYDVLTDQEHWPFSNYPMFSGVWSSRTFTWLRLFGVRSDGSEFPLDANRYIQPFDQSRLPKALRRMLDRPDGAARVRIALADCLRRYDELRVDGRHAGPPLVALRLYELEWAIDPQARNVDHPERKQLVAELRRQ